MNYLRDLVQVNAAYVRSANIELDAKAWLGQKPHYVDTPLGRSVMQRVIRNLSPKGNRAWCLVGPYGSGKSTFVLALSQILCGSSSSILEEYGRRDPEFADEVSALRKTRKPFLPVLLSGRHGSLLQSLKKAIAKAIKDPGAGDMELKELLRLAEDPDTDADEVCRLVMRLASARSDGGLIIVIDELGKFIEYAVQQSTTGEIFLLQMLAETVARSTEPIVLMTVLHQDFDRYASLLSETQRDELSKVQGRFETIAFQQPSEQILDLLGSAITVQASGQRLVADARKIAERAYSLGLSPVGLNQHVFTEMMAKCPPLHPLSTLLLAPLFRRLAQNERSVFAFLSSKEPFAFQHFLENTPTSATGSSMLTPDILYDYVLNAYGTSLYQYSTGRKWAQIETALERLLDPTDLELRVIKLVGLLSALGDKGAITTKEEIIEFALQQYGDVKSVLKKLCRESILVWRSFNNTYRLWDGSDVDIEERLPDAKRAIDETQALETLLSELDPPKPVIAGYHSHRTGTLRFFEVRYCSQGSLMICGMNRSGEADGQILYLLVESEAQAQQIRTAIPEQLNEDPLTIIATVLVDPSCKKAALELKRLYWVEENTPELSEDLIARKELSSRITEARNALRLSLNRTLHRSLGVKGLVMGKGFQFENWRDFNRFLSKQCDSVFHCAPEIRNELINRRHLSSAAAKGRRDLLEAMITNAQVEDLGIEGFPPQKSMYLSLLKNNGLHRQAADTWKITRPGEGGHMEQIWIAWDDFLGTTVETRRPLSELWDQLRRPPFGLTEGVIPVLIVAMLLERDLEAAIYVEGSFVPYLTVPLVERFLKNPDRFEVRYCKMDSIHIALLEELRKLGAGNREGDTRILSAVRPLCQTVAQLPGYTRNTHSMSKEAQLVREAILTAKDPARLLFEDLPLALGFPSISEAQPGQNWVKEYSKSLMSAIAELTRSYEELLNRLVDLMGKAFCHSTSREKVRAELRSRSQLLKPYCVDLRMRGFLNRLGDRTLPADKWVESVATFICGKPPVHWNDDDTYRFDLNLKQMAKALNDLEKLAYVLSSGQGNDKAKTESAVAQSIERSVSRLEEVLTKEFGEENIDLKLAALARLLEVWTQDGQKKGLEEVAGAKE